MRHLYALIGDSFHPPEYIREGLQRALAPGFDSLSGQSVSIQTRPESIPWKDLQSGDLLILFKETRIESKNDPDALWMTKLWLTAEHETVIGKFVQQGGGLIVLHSGLVIHPTCGEFRELTKGHFLHHPKGHPVIKVSPTRASHPLLDGIEAFEITDEQYFVEVDEADTDMLLRGESQEHGQCRVGWAHTYGEGRVCCLTPGHTLEVLSQPGVQRLIRNAVRWCVEA